MDGAYKGATQVRATAPPRWMPFNTDAYYQHQQKMSYKETSNQLTQLKKNPDFSWFQNVTAVPLQQALRHLNTAFLNFFSGRAKYPTILNTIGNISRN